VSASRQIEPPGEPGVDMAAIELLAARIAELLAGQLSPSAPEAQRPSRLLSAAEVSEWWGVRRSWVYQHASELGAIRIGDGERPRLRFDPDKVAQHLNQPAPSPPTPVPTRTTRPPRSSRMRGDSRRLAFRVDPELSSPGTNIRMAGRRANAPGRGAEDNAFGAMSSLPPPAPGVARTSPPRPPALRRHNHQE
jgi:hypothetical protein